MANIILLEPSCDIHLVRSDFPVNKQAVQLRVFTGDPNLSKFFVINELLDPLRLQQLHFDFFPLNQNMVRFDAATRTITPGVGTGTVHMQVRYLDPDLDPQDQYHYLVTRIQVHERMNGWWFGNSSLSVFHDPGMAHSQPSLYALFDREQPGGGEVGDITGHGYVDLSIDDTSICVIDMNATGTGAGAPKFKDRLRGLKLAKLGDAKLSGSLLGRNQEIPLQVVEAGYRPGTPLNPVLQRQPDFFDATVSRAERHNILFLSEGVVADNAGKNKAQFDATVTQTSHLLFDSERHAPYNVLKDGFNVWSHFEPSNQTGVTCGPQLNKHGIQIPEDSDPPEGSPPNTYSLFDLLKRVGLPTAADAPRSVEQLKDIWNAAGSVPRLLGYQNALAVPEIVEAWKELLPVGIPQAVDTFYGTILGRRWGDRTSNVEQRAEMVSPPAAGDPNFDKLHAALAARMHEWYIPDGVSRVPRPDRRRFAPEFQNIEIFVLSGNFRSLADPLADPSNPFEEADHKVGSVWHEKTLPDPNIPTRQINSAGLVAILVNAERNGGNTIRRGVLYITLGSNEGFTFDVDTADPNIRPLTLTPVIKPNLSTMVDGLAHEFGHSLNLGDEYEEFSGPEPETRGESFDNLTQVGIIQRPLPPGGHSENFPIPIDPDKVKWVGLHRISTSDMLTRNATANGNQIVVQLPTGATAKWHRIQAKNQKVVLRQFHATATDIRQLPINPVLLRLDLVIARDLVITSISDNDSSLTLTGGFAAPNNEFSAGSVVYVPKSDDGDQLQLVESEVRAFMRLQSWNPSDPNFPSGRSLTENHNAATVNKSDSADDDADNPPDIPDIEPPCKRYKLIGLYEGGGRFTTHTYRPSGACKMRNHKAKEGEGEFCFVCKYLIVNRVNAGKHALLDARYYPHKKQFPRFLRPLPINIRDID